MPRSRRPSTSTLMDISTISATPRFSSRDKRDVEAASSDEDDDRTLDQICSTVSRLPLGAVSGNRSTNSTILARNSLVSRKLVWETPADITATPTPRRSTSITIADPFETPLRRDPKRRLVGSKPLKKLEAASPFASSLMPTPSTSAFTQSQGPHSESVKVLKASKLSHVDSMQLPAITEMRISQLQKEKEESMRFEAERRDRAASLSSRLADSTIAESVEEVSILHSEPTIFPPEGPQEETLILDSDSNGNTTIAPESEWDASETTASSQSTNSGILSFSPPVKSRSPLKLPPPQNEANLAATPPQSPSKSRLISPSKKVKNIPPTPHRPSLDAFWSQEKINGWNDEYSPRKKLLISPKKLQLSLQGLHLGSDETGAIPLSPSKKEITAQQKATKKEFDSKKVNIAETFFRELDEKISNGQIQELACSAGGVNIYWSKKLNTTAGRAHWKRELVKDADGMKSASGNSPVYKHNASIELAEKVIDSEDRLLNVIAHEYCHLANFMVSNVRTNPHGASFKDWASRVTAAFSHRGVNVTTKHDYVIAYKYAWACTNEAECGTEYERHSRSIDPKKHTCGKCKARLVQIRPAPRKQKIGSASPAKGAGTGGDRSTPVEDDAVPKKSEYQLFIQQNFRTVREQLGQKSPMKEVMRELGARYREHKGRPQQQQQQQQQQQGQGLSPAKKDDEEVEVADDDEENDETVVTCHDDEAARDSGDEEIDGMARVLDVLQL